MVNTPREIEMAEAASSKRQSPGDTNGNPKKKSTIQQGSSYVASHSVQEL
jgi:hypothetical protein